jgi:hypothetical protein
MSVAKLCLKFQEGQVTAVTSMNVIDSIDHRGRSLLWAAPHHSDCEGDSVVGEFGRSEEDGGVMKERA